LGVREGLLKATGARSRDFARPCAVRLRAHVSCMKRSGTRRALKTRRNVPSRTRRRCFPFRFNALRAADPGWH
jgi:hypothetical protein